MKTFSQFISEAKEARQKGYVLFGRPGSGKTSIVRHMQSQNPNVTHHELDKSRRELGMHPAAFNPELKQHHDSGIEASVRQGNTPVVSNTALPREHRNASIEHLRSQGVDARAVALPTSRKAAIRRNRKRTEGRVPDVVANTMDRTARGINTNPRGGGAVSRADLRQGRAEFKQLHRQYRFTRPAMERSGAIPRRIRKKRKNN